MIDAYSRVFGPGIRQLRPDQSIGAEHVPERLESNLGESVAAK